MWGRSWCLRLERGDERRALVEEYVITGWSMGPRSRPATNPQSAGAACAGEQSQRESAMRFVERLSSLEGRLLTGIAMALAITVGLWPAHGAIDPVRLIAVVSTSLAWLFAELKSGYSPSRHDVGLLESITNEFTDGVLHFLRTHDFGTPFARVMVDPVHDVAAWRGVRWEFADAKLQTRWADVQGQDFEFSSALAANTHNITGSTTFFTVHPDNNDRENPTPQTLATIADLNLRADRLHASLSNFERFARKRLKL